MKTIKILGKSIPVFALILIGLGTIGTATLVGYLSNQISTSLSVNSPLELKMSLDGLNWQTGWMSLGSIYGGENVTFYVQTHNLANVSQTGVMWNIVNNPSGITCNDFVSLKGQPTEQDESSTIYPESDLVCVNITDDSYNVRIITTPTEEWTWHAGHQDSAKVTIVFKDNAFGAYTLTTQVVPLGPPGPHGG